MRQTGPAPGAAMPDQPDTRTRFSGEAGVSGLPGSCASITNPICTGSPIERSATAALAVRRIGAGIELRRLVRHPADEGLDVFVPLQRVPGMVGAQQLALRQGRMDLPVADLMDRKLFPALQRFRHKVVAVDVDGAERAPAQ